jgi:hypothetical protein
LLDKVASSPVEVEENVAVRNEMLREQRRNIRGLVTVTATTAAVVPVQEELASNSPTSSRRFNVMNEPSEKNSYGYEHERTSFEIVE